ncbi:hypothetical protein GASC598I20_003360, partial [Gilliamella apicola SCGC AB-598-I20]
IYNLKNRVSSVLNSEVPISISVDITTSSYSMAIN